MNRTWKKIAIYPLISLVAAATMGACSSDSDSDSAPVTTEAAAPTDAPGTTTEPGSTDPDTTDTTDSDDPASTTTSAAGGDGDCFAHLYDGDDFDATDENFKLTDEGRYATMDDLPGANANWTGDADSIQVGDGATVTIWEKENFEGASQELDAGSQNADVEEPSSIELSCS